MSDLLKRARSLNPEYLYGQLVHELADEIERLLTILQELEEFLDDQADVDDGIPNNAMRHLVEVREAIAKATGAA